MTKIPDLSTELFEAIKRHDLNDLARLLKNGAGPDAAQPRHFRWSPLQEGWHTLYAAIEELEEGGSIEALVLLLRYGASVEGWRHPEHNDSPLLMALFRDQVEAVRVLLAAGADPNVEGCEGDTPLRWSAEHGDISMAAILLRCGATNTIDNAGGPTGRTALGWAAHSLNIPMVELLLDFGASVYAFDADHRTARMRMSTRDASNGQTWDIIAQKLDTP
jgi:hypothetical protein